MQKGSEAYITKTDAEGIANRLLYNSFNPFTIDEISKDRNCWIVDYTLTEFSVTKKRRLIIDSFGKIVGIVNNGQHNS